MPDALPPDELPFTLPSSFFEVLIGDIPVETWVSLLKVQPTLKASLLEGFTVSIGKLGRLLRQPHLAARLQRLLRSNERFLNDIIQVWGQERLSTVAFLEMLDRDFLLENWQSLKNFIGPERFLAGLKVLGRLTDTEFQQRMGEDFWERPIDMELIGPMIPFRELWHGFIRQFPEARFWFEQMGSSGGEEAADRPRSGLQGLPKQLRALEERCSKVQKKLDRAEEEKSRMQQEAIRFRSEQEELRKQLADREASFDREVRRVLTQARHEWFRRYRSVDQASLSEASNGLDTLLERADHAFALQRRADEEYGLVAAVRQKLFRVDWYLEEFERIYADSLVVHSEVTRMKEALLEARAKLLRLPGIQKVLKTDVSPLAVNDLRRQIRFVDPTPENLPRMTELHALVTRLADLGLIADLQTVMEDIEHKKRQIMENLYADYQMLQDQLPRGRYFENLEDFVKSRQSSNYDLYVDGYNILLSLHGRNRPGSFPLMTLREQFTAAVVRKSHLFRRVYLVFDGQENSRDRQGNAEIIFTDKSRGNTADAYIIEAVRKRKERRVLLATGDQEIIRSLEDRIYALVAPYHLYLFMYDMQYPDLV